MSSFQNWNTSQTRKWLPSVDQKSCDRGGELVLRFLLPVCEPRNYLSECITIQKLYYISWRISSRFRLLEQLLCRFSRMQVEPLRQPPILSFQPSVALHTSHPGVPHRVRTLENLIYFEINHFGSVFNFFRAVLDSFQGLHFLTLKFPTGWEIPIRTTGAARRSWPLWGKCCNGSGRVWIQDSVVPCPSRNPQFLAEGQISLLPFKMALVSFPSVSPPLSTLSWFAFHPNPVRLAHIPSFLAKRCSLIEYISPFRVVNNYSSYFSRFSRISTVCCELVSQDGFPCSRPPGE